MQTARWLRKPVDYLADCHERYGDVFTAKFIGVGEMVWISHPDAIKTLFGLDRENLLPPGRNFLLEPVMGARSILLQEGAEHLRRRKLMLPSFHGERMKAYEDTIAEITGAEMEGWPLGESFPLHPRMQAITLEVILRAVFGVTDAERLTRLRAVFPKMLAMTESGRSQAIGLAVRRFGSLGPWRIFQTMLDEIDAVIAEEVAERRAAHNLDERPDILSMLVAARDEDGEAMSDSELRDQLMTLLLAGHETTATALAWTFDLLLRNPVAMEKLTAELATDGDEYLDAVIEESLRVRPVVPTTGRRLSAPAEIAGYELPAETSVMAAIFLAHMREDLYPEPSAFKPERFLANRPETFSWIPFGGGTRRCLGGAFATMEMRVVLRTVLGGAVLEGARSGARADRPAQHHLLAQVRNPGRFDKASVGFARCFDGLGFGRGR